MSIKQRIKKILPSARDLHLYGGAVLAAVGVGFVYWPAGLMMLGAYLVYLGRPWK